MSTTQSFARLDMAPVWKRFNDELIRLVEYVPDDKMNWSPKPELWNFRGLLLHIASARENWLGGLVRLEGEGIDVYGTVRSKEQIQDAFRRTWLRVETFLTDQAKLDRTYRNEEGDVTGHWIAFHLLEHDIHHRANIFDYLALLGIETPGVGTP
jgi:uncharacterized damage-inducible protein DinB